MKGFGGNRGYGVIYNKYNLLLALIVKSKSVFILLRLQLTVLQEQAPVCRLVVLELRPRGIVAACRESSLCSYSCWRVSVRVPVL